MTAHAIVLLERDGNDIVRWVAAAAIVLAAHLGLAASYLLFASQEPQGMPIAPIVIDLAPMPVAPASPADVAPGPEMVEARMSPPEPQATELPPPEPLLEPPPPPPVQPLVTLPEPPPPRPPEVKEEPKPEEKPPEQKPVERKKPAPRTAAAPRSERSTADKPSAPSAGSVSAAAALASWRDLVVAQLQRSKRYPSSAEARREQGVVTLSFSLGRNGNVLSRSIARSSGYSELDQEVLTMVMRAQPFPAFPSSMTQARINLSVPVRFSLR